MAKIVVTFEYTPNPEQYEDCSTEFECAQFDAEALDDWQMTLDEMRELSSVTTTIEAVE